MFSCSNEAYASLSIHQCSRAQNIFGVLRRPGSLPDSDDGGCLSIYGELEEKKQIIFGFFAQRVEKRCG